MLETALYLTRRINPHFENNQNQQTAMVNQAARNTRMNTTPEFLAAVDMHHAMRTTMGEDHPLTQRALTLVMELAPDELKTLMADKAREMGLMPEAHGYLDDGSPVYRLESIAEKMGVSADEVQDSVQAFMADRAALGLDTTPIDPALIHIRQ
jgi:hypothetical protein